MLEAILISSTVRIVYKVAGLKIMQKEYFFLCTGDGNKYSPTYFLKKQILGATRNICWNRKQNIGFGFCICLFSVDK